MRGVLNTRQIKYKRRDLNNIPLKVVIKENTTIDVLHKYEQLQPHVNVNIKVEKPVEHKVIEYGVTGRDGTIRYVPMN